MGLRCERCKTADLTLETFGVYQCPNCGRVDADGNLLDAPKGTDDTGPQTFETERASFVAPPPAGSVAAAAVIPAAPVAREMPQVFLWTMGISAILDIVGVIASRNVCGFVFRVAFYVALMTGKPWARALSMVGALLTLAACVFLALLVPGAATVVRLVMTVLVVANAWWLYVLLRPDTIEYFSRK